MALKCIVGRIGGKSRLKKIIVDEYFPKDYESMIYVEPFVGGGSIFFYKNPSVIEVVNDIDINIYTIFKGATKYTHEDVSLAIDKIYTKEEFNIIRDNTPKNEFELFCKYYFLAQMSIMCMGRTFYTNRPKINTNLKGYKERLEDVEIYNVDYKELITKYDSNETFFYLDPPYENSKGLYKHSEVILEDMFNILKNIKGKFLLSYNNSERAKELFKNYNIKEVITKYNATTFNKKNKDTTTIELLISNYKN